MEEIALVLLIALAVLVILSRSLRSLLRTSGATNIPGPATWPIIGNADFFMGVTDVESALQAFTKMATAHEAPLSRVWLGPKLVILVKSPKYIEALLTHKAATNKDDFFYKSIKDATGNGVFTRNGDAWQRLRKPMANLLKPKNINNFQEIICQKVDNLCREFELKTNSEPFDISAYVKLCSGEVISEAGVGINIVDGLGNAKFELIHGIEKEVAEIFVNMWSWQSILGFKKYTPTVELRKHFLYELKKKMQERRMQLKSLGMNSMEEKPENYADVVMRIGEIEGKNQYDTALLLADFYIAGSDTQSVVIIVLLYLLAIHQEYQEKIYQELVDIFGYSDRDPQEDDLKHMVYLEMCIKEALRHCSPPAVGRAVEEDIEIDGYIIPKGAALVFTLYLTLEDPKYWERPGEFFPEHFRPEAVAKRPKGAFLPFVAGPKMCPGQLYSFQSMKTVVSTLLRRYHFTTNHKYSDLKYKYLLMREPVNPEVKITKRLPVDKSTHVL